MRSWNTLSGFIRTQAIVSMVDAIFIGLGLQKAQNSIMEWWDTRRGYAETP